jgi:hypothetical protein
MKSVRILLMLTMLAGAFSFAQGDDRPMTDEEAQRRHDQLHAAVQEICPISGEKLGDHGPPIKVTVGKHKEEIFLCCKACLQRKINPKHWATIHANFAKAQQICPVMKKPLPKNPKWTIADGQIIYICCPPCTKKIAAAPKVFLDRVDQLYAASLKDRQSTR